MKVDVKFFEKYRKQCERANGNKPVLIPVPDEKNGFIHAKIMFINERPGRIGTGKSGKISPDNDDPSANLFKKLLNSINLDRKDIFITNACLFYPDDPTYKDTPLIKKELLHILEDQVNTIKPRLIVTMGNTALNYLKKIFRQSKQLKNFRLKNDIGIPITDTAIPIFPLYHTSLRARLTRKESQQSDDWIKLSKWITN